MPPPDDAPHDAASGPSSPPPTGEYADDGGEPASEHDAAAADDSRRVGARYGLPGRFEQSDLEAEVVGDIFDTNEIFTRIVTNADREFGHSTQLLFWSGLAAGLAISLSFLGMATVEGALGMSPAARITAALLYPLGFIFTVLGRYQLFTENTLTPVTLVLTRRASIPRLMRIWGLVLGANVLGTAFAGFYFSQTDILSGPAAEAGIEIGRHLLEMGWWTLFFKGTIAGWLVAGMVWLNHAARTATARLFIVFALMFTVAAADLAHCIVGSSEVLYLVFEGEATVLDYFWRFLAPAALGNTVGGVVLVALLNYAQTGGEVQVGLQRLSWREWLLGTAPHEPAA
ncbi:MAG: transporter [Bacteroidetes bacterium QS_7_67_15]|nr:MAG: transporter [Bacteroidetes bacterium QS_7_67_15]